MLVYQRVHDFPITTSIYGGFPSLQCLMTPEAMETLETLFFFAAFLLGISWLTHFRKRLVDPTFWSDRVHLAGEKRIMRMVLWTVFGVFFLPIIFWDHDFWCMFSKEKHETPRNPPQPPQRRKAILCRCGFLVTKLERQKRQQQQQRLWQSLVQETWGPWEILGFLGQFWMGTLWLCQNSYWKWPSRNSGLTH